MYWNQIRKATIPQNIVHYLLKSDFQAMQCYPPILKQVASYWNLCREVAHRTTKHLQFGMISFPDVPYTIFKVYKQRYTPSTIRKKIEYKKKLHKIQNLILKMVTKNTSSNKSFWSNKMLEGYIYNRMEASCIDFRYKKMGTYKICHNNNGTQVTSQMIYRSGPQSNIYGNWRQL